MEVKKYNLFVIKTRHKAKTKPTPKIKLEAKGQSLKSKKKLDIIYVKGFVKTSRKWFDYNIDYITKI